jgi:hypothetical protein
MNILRYGAIPALLLLFLVSGCTTSQARPNRVGEVGYDVRHERSMAAQRSARMHYEYLAPKASATIRSNPEGALLEWYNQEGIWVAIGTTPVYEVVIEATGKPELFRISKPGYLPQSRWVAATPSSGSVDVEFTLDRDEPGFGVIFRD